MKKLFLILFVFISVISFCACQQTNGAINQTISQIPITDSQLTYPNCIPPESEFTSPTDSEPTVSESIPLGSYFTDQNVVFTLDNGKNVECSVIQLTQSLENCSSVTVNLVINEFHSGSIYGEWGFYIREISGNWRSIGTFVLSENSTSAVFSFNEPVSFDAWACPCLVLGDSWNFSFSAWLDQVQIANPDESFTDPIVTNPTYEFLLCSGTDLSGNNYKLVANQEETSSGHQITVGVIKNNQWLYPMSPYFPFLGENNLFHVDVPMGGESGTSLNSPNTVINNMYFIDTGAFLMDRYTSNDSLSLYDHSKIIFNCSTLECYDVDCNEYSVLYQKWTPQFSGDIVTSFGYIRTDAGKILMYQEISDTNSGWLSDQVFNWYTFDTNTFTMTSVLSDVTGIKPESIVSEGLFFASDQCFYDVRGEKIIDLSAYKIDMYYNSDIYFENGTCTFIAENDLGTQFLITIDANGNIIDEKRN